VPEDRRRHRTGSGIYETVFRVILLGIFGESLRERSSLDVPMVNVGALS